MTTQEAKGAGEACCGDARAEPIELVTDKRRVRAASARHDAGAIKAAVRERYGAVARSAASCCGPGNASALYGEGELQGLPESVTQASAGCGNPLALSEIRPGDTVLDLGSGGGIDCFLAAREAGPQGRVIGLDMTPEMVALATANRDKLGLTNVELRLGEIERIPLQDSSVDVIISNCVINLSPDKDAVFREAFRVLRPGGRLCVSDVVLTGDLPEAVAADLRQWTACVGGALPKETYLAKLGAAGFDRIETLEERPFGAGGCDGAAASVKVKAVKPAR